MAEILEHVIIELLGIVNSYLSWDVVVADYVLLEDFLDSPGAYICEGLRLNPIHEIIDRYDSEGVVSLGWS
jgi:hypothetical protein